MEPHKTHNNIGAWFSQKTYFLGICKFYMLVFRWVTIGYHWIKYFHQIFMWLACLRLTFDPTLILFVWIMATVTQLNTTDKSHFFCIRNDRSHVGVGKLFKFLSKLIQWYPVIFFGWSLSQHASHHQEYHSFSGTSHWQPGKRGHLLWLFMILFLQQSLGKKNPTSCECLFRVFDTCWC